MNILISSLHTISLNLPKTNLFYISSDPTDSANSSFLKRACSGVAVTTLKWLNQVFTSRDVQPYLRNQHHSSIWSWYITDSVLIITFHMLRCSMPHPYTWRESNRLIYRYLTTEIWRRFSSIIISKRFTLACQTTPAWNNRG